MLKVRINVHKIETTLDKGVKVTFYTPEVGPDATTELFKLKTEGECIAAFQPLERQAPDITEIGDPSSKKSPSERYRNTLYVYFTQMLGRTEGFNSWYADWMEKAILKIKAKLPPM